MNSKDLNDVFEREDEKEYVKDDITLTDTKESITRKKRQPKAKTIDIDFEKDKEDFLKSLLLKADKEEEPKKETKVNTDSNERKLKLIENLKKAREQKKLNKQQPQQPQQEVKKEQPKEIIKEQIKEVVKEDPEYLEWKRQKQLKQEVKMEPKPEIKQEQKPEVIRQEEPKKEYIKISNFKKPLWSK